MTNAGNLWNQVPQEILSEAIKKSTDNTRQEIAENVQEVL